MYDAVVIGAGVTGSFVAYELSKYNLKICLVEKAPEPAWGCSRANSGIVHAGYDPEEGSLKAQLNVQGSKMMEQICKEMDVPYKKTGTLVLAFTDEQMDHIKMLKARGDANGVEDLEVIGETRLYELEPNINRNAKGALYAPTGAVVCPYELTIAAAETAVLNGAEFMPDTEVLKIEDGTVYTDKGELKTKFIFNCAGLYADKLSDGEFEIIPRKGEYMLYDKQSSGIVNHVLFHTPDKEKGKGILVSPTVHGNMIIGPNSVVVDDKEDTSTTAEGFKELFAGSADIMDNTKAGIITSFSGLRTISSTGDFIIGYSAKGNSIINVAGIESPGLSSSPAIAVYAVDLAKNAGLALDKKAEFKNRKPVVRINELPIEQQNEKIKENSTYGKIVCRCETITEGEIVDAINRPAGARTVDGVKRRTRAGMGRCQGGFCMPKVVEIIARELKISPLDVIKSDKNSKILSGRNV